MGFLGDILGGGSSTSNVPLLTRGQRRLLKQITSQVSQGIGKPGEVFQGQRVAGLSPLEQQAASFIGGPGFQQGLANLGQANQFYQGQVNEQFNPQQVTQDFNVDTLNPAMRNFQQNVIPGISERFAGGNALRSGAFGTTLAQAGSDLQSNLAAQLGQRQVAERGAVRGRRAAGARGLMGTSLMPQQLIAPLLGIGGLQRGIQQQQLGAEHARFQEGQPMANPLLRLLSPALGTQAFQPVMSQQAGLGSILGPGLGAFMGTETGAAGIMGGLGSLFSPAAAPAAPSAVLARRMTGLI